MAPLGPFGTGRKLTCLCYLNNDWNAAADGGALRLHARLPAPDDNGSGGGGDAGGDAKVAEAGAAAESDRGKSAIGRDGDAVDIYPQGGRLVMFFSDEVAALMLHRLSLHAPG